MEVTALCLRLMMTVTIVICGHDPRASAASFQIFPNRLQFFEYEPLTLHCTEDIYYGVIHETKGIIESCNTTQKIRLAGFTCFINNVYPEDSGEYWCETKGGNRSNIISITVTGGSVILDSPALPMMEGDPVTLSCRNKMASSNFTTDFYKDGLHIRSSSTESVTISKVSMSDEGLYKCKISGVGESAESRLAVRASSVILESPALPVFEGESVTLSCRKKMASNFTADFYKDGLHISSSSTGSVTVYNVSKSDEGLYRCKIPEFGESAESWLAVRGHCLQKPLEHGCHVYVILRTIGTVVMVALLLLVVGLLHYGKLGTTGLNSHPLRSKCKCNKLSQVKDRS